MQRFDNNPDFERIQLCSHGVACPYWAAGTCGFAHSLAELLPPREVDREYRGVWTDGVDRWYGQEQSHRQIQRIKEYHRREHECEIPVWVKGLAWFHTNKAVNSYLAQPWDFGLWQDVDTLKRSRRVLGPVPFSWARRADGTSIWEALERRRDALKGRIPLAPPRLALPAVPSPDGMQTPQAPAALAVPTPALALGLGGMHTAAAQVAQGPASGGMPATASAGQGLVPSDGMASPTWLAQGVDRMPPPAQEAAQEPESSDGIATSSEGVQFLGRSQGMSTSMPLALADGIPSQCPSQQCPSSASVAGQGAGLAQGMSSSPGPGLEAESAASSMTVEDVGSDSGSIARLPRWDRRYIHPEFLD